MKTKTHIFDLKLKDTFRISREARDVQQTLIIELIDGKLSGFGEAPATKFYGVNINSMLKKLEDIEPFLQQHTFDHPDLFWSQLAPKLHNFPFLLCALNNAAYDLFGKKKQLPVYKILNLNLENLPKTNYTIGIDSIEKMVEKIKAQPWPIYKIKLGTEQDIEIIENLRKQTDAIFRVDANCGWTAKQTIKYSKILKNLGVEYIEQPLPAEKKEEMLEVFEKSELPIIADESCQKEEDVEKCAPFFHSINIKLTKCGGLTPALRMIKKARKNGLKIMAGCMTESTIGISAIAHILPLLDFVDMDGPLLLSNDPAEGIDFDFGKVILSDSFGLGCRLK